MKNNRDFKKVFKVFLLVFILILCIYVLYFYNNNSNNNNTLENFATSNNCSECKVNPSNNNKCKPIYNINYKWDPKKKMVDISNVMTDYILCDWEPNCDNDAMENNYLTQEQRLGLSNAQLQKNINVVS